MHEWRENEQQSNFEIKKLEDFSFSEVKVFQNDQKDPEEIKIEYNGEQLDFKFAHIKQDGSREHFFIDAFKEDEMVVYVTMEIIANNITSLIGKMQKFQDDEKFKGLGTRLYFKMLQFCQDLSDRRGITYTHSVEKSPDFSKKENKNDETIYAPMSDEEAGKIWDSIFKDLLINEGYVKKVTKEGEFWEKKYKPKV